MMRFGAVCVVALLFWTACASANTTEVEITVPESARSLVKGLDAYICTTIQLPQKPYKLVGIEPLAEQKVVHHILLFGCDVPYIKPKGGEQTVWDCKHAPTCGSSSETIMYGWGRNAPRLDLPPGVGFSVGRGSAVKWVVVQVHYLAEKPPGDESGVRMKLQDDPVPFSAGLLSYASWFSIPPRKKSHLVQNNCCYRGFQPLTTFAVRVHTHTMGRAVFMTRLPTMPGKGEIVAAGDPQQPQGFNPVRARVLWPGDRLTVACDFDSSDKTVAVGAGPTHEHEMCNMYLMVYSQVPHIEMCSDGMSMVDEYTPGNLPRAAALLPDPFPLWRPPKPTDKWNSSVLGNIASVAAGADGTIWALHRGGRVWDGSSFDGADKLTVKDPINVDVVVQMHADTGKVLRTWGSGHFYMPHMITVDRNNSVWITDVGRHQALKFTASGQLLMAVGKFMEPGHDRAHLCKPTQVAVMNDGSFLIADGYCNSRVMRYRPDGTFHSLYKLGSPNDKDQGGKGMGVAHSVVVNECDGEVLVADRELMRVHKFRLDGPRNLIETVSIKQHGKVWALVMGPYGRVLALAWSPGRDAVIVDVSLPAFNWKLPNSTQMWPHDLAVGPAALELTGAGDRLLTVYVAPLCEECGPLQKFVMFPKNFGGPPQDMPKPLVVPATQRPLAHLGVGSHAHQHKPAPAAEEQKPEDAQEFEVDEAEDKKDEEQEEEVEKEEEQDDAEEVEEMEKPELKQQLTSQLENVEKELEEDGVAEADETEDYKIMHSRGTHSSSQGLLSGVLIVVVVGVLLGVLLLGVSVHALHKHVMGGKKGAAGGTANGVGVGGAARREYRQPPAQHSIDGMLEKDEEDLGRLPLERDGLLRNGLRS